MYIVAYFCARLAFKQCPNSFRMYMRFLGLLLVMGLSLPVVAQSGGKKTTSQSPQVAPSDFKIEGIVLDDNGGKGKKQVLKPVGYVRTPKKGSGKRKLKGRTAGTSATGTPAGQLPQQAVGPVHPNTFILKPVENEGPQQPKKTDSVEKDVPVRVPATEKIPD
jgi:hypothetical protein